MLRRLVPWSVLAHSLACVNPGVQTCGDVLCPGDLVCVTERGGCYRQDQITACDGIAEGDPCTFGDTSSVCIGGVCSAAICGDDLVTPPEDCDGPDLGGMTCADLGYYEADGLACTSYCRFDVSNCFGTCGDEIANGDELCDGAPPDGLSCVEFGFDLGAPDCSAACAPDFGPCKTFGWRTGTFVPGLGYGNGAWASSEDDIYFVDTTTDLFHFDGVAWETIAFEEKLYGVTGTSADKVWVVGEGGFISHFDGSTWTEQNSTVSVRLTDVWAASESEVFACGRDETIVHLMDGAWTKEDTTATVPTHFAAIHGSSQDNVYAAASGGSIYRYDGVSWSPASSTGVLNSDVWVASDEVVVVASSTSDIRRLVEGLWEDVPGITAYHLWGASPTSIFASRDGALAHFNGQSWAKIDVDPLLNTDGAIWGLDSNNLVLGAQGRTLRFEGYGWEPTMSAIANSATHVAAMGRDDIYVRHDSSVLIRFDGSEWEVVPGAFAGLWALDGEVYVASGFVLERWNGSGWDAVDPPIAANVQALWQAPTGVLYAGVADGTIRRVEGMNWVIKHTLSDPSEDFVAIVGTGADDIIAVGKSGTIATWNGTQWTETDLGVSLSSAWAAPGVAYVAGLELYRRDGTSWIPIALPITGGWWHLTGSSATDVYAAGPSGQIFHSDGAGWSSVTTRNTSSWISAAHAGPGVRVFAHPIDSIIQILYVPMP